MTKRLVYLLSLLAAACASSVPGPQPTVPVTPSGESTGAAVVRRPLPEARPPGTAAAPMVTQPSTPGVAVPPGLLYVCVTQSGGTQKQVGIEFAPKVHDLCSRHPEMGPCQYERQACRNGGGRVFASSGAEITLATEAEYDRKVMRVRFRAN